MAGLAKGGADMMIYSSAANKYIWAGLDCQNLEI